MGANIMTGKAATGTGAWVKSGAAHHGILITFSAGTLSALTVTLEGRIAGGAEVTLGTKQFSGGELTAAAAYLFVANTPVDDIRANVTVYTVATGAPAIKVDYKSSLN